MLSDSSPKSCPLIIPVTIRPVTQHRLSLLLLPTSAPPPSASSFSSYPSSPSTQISFLFSSLWSTGSPSMRSRKIPVSAGPCNASRAMKLMLSTAVAFEKLIYCLFGLYVWELFQTCDFEWSIVTRQRKFTWPMVC